MLGEVEDVFVKSAVDVATVEVVGVGGRTTVRQQD
jgi:hypothetical protein